MQIAAVYDTGTLGQEFIKTLGKGQVSKDEVAGYVVWHFDHPEEAENLMMTLFRRTGDDDLILVMFVASDDEDLNQYLPM